MRNLRLIIAYDGTDFHGWQRQPGRPTVQGCLESAIERLVGEKITLHGSGRTDAGVHALNQVANFKTQNPIPAANLLPALNNLLPATVRIRSAEEVEEGFHSRHAARAKTYRYRILCAPLASPFVVRFVYHYPYPLDRARMAAAARRLEGTHDFSSLAASSGEEGSEPGDHTDLPGARSNIRTIYASRLTWRPRASILAYQVRGSGFLHHMVRNIVGTLIEAGRGKLAGDDIDEILKARDRRRAGPTAPASGLCLVGVEY